MLNAEGQSLVLNLTTEEMGTLLGPTNRLPIQVVAVSLLNLRFTW